MNSLSWMIYFANVVGSIKDALGVMTFISIIGFVFSAFPLIVMAVEGDETSERMETVARPIRRMAAVSFIVAGAASALFPTRDTVILIAASELGERAITQPATAELLSDVGEIIRSEVKKLKEKAK